MEQFGLKKTDILLPKKDFEEFSVIACDQYTSQPEYWDEVKNIVKDAPSALNMILPEIYLENDTENRIEKINETMQNYLDSGVFKEYKDSMIYLERTTCEGFIRRGLVGVVDLEDYDYTPGSKKLVRATEQTVLSRIPPRVKIRENAPLEMPHIMLMTDDPKNTVFDMLTVEKDKLEKVYDFDLMMNAGHACGYLLNDELMDRVSKAFSDLVKNSDDKMLFAVGDGNHSLATAKECYNKTHAALSRYAMAEVVNIHDESIQFEPIYRVLFNCDKNDVLNYLLNNAKSSESEKSAQKFECVYGDEKSEIYLKPSSKLAVGTLQKLLDEYLAAHSKVKIDYIHGTETVYNLCKEENTLGFIFDGMKKDELFEAVRKDGSLPRKTFSMGHADDKRFYIESRKIK